QGRVVVPGDPGYDRARAVWNATADAHPAVVARCAGPGDVVEAVRFARDQDLLVAVRGGGHSYPGFSTCDGGVVVDLSPMAEVRVDPGAPGGHGRRGRPARGARRPGPGVRPGLPDGPRLPHRRRRPDPGRRGRAADPPARA